jgi:hypothetical protein
MSAHCPFEGDVVKAGDRDRWPEALRRHVPGCEICSAAAAVSPWMQRFATTSDRQHKLPDPAVVWLKAQLLKNTIAADRAGRPITVVQMAAYIVVGGAWAALLTWKWDALHAWFLALDPTRWLSGTVATGVDNAALSAGFFVTVFMLASVTIILALHTVVAED